MHRLGACSKQSLTTTRHTFLTLDSGQRAVNGKALSTSFATTARPSTCAIDFMPIRRMRSWTLRSTPCDWPVCSSPGSPCVSAVLQDRLGVTARGASPCVLLDRADDAASIRLQGHRPWTIWTLLAQCWLRSPWHGGAGPEGLHQHGHRHGRCDRGRHVRFDDGRPASRVAFVRMA